MPPVRVQEGEPKTNGAPRMPWEARPPISWSVAPQSKSPLLGCTFFQPSRKRSVFTPVAAIVCRSVSSSVGPWAMPKNSDRAAWAVGAAKRNTTVASMAMLLSGRHVSSTRRGKAPRRSVANRLGRANGRGLQRIRASRCGSRRRPGAIQHPVWALRET